MLLSPHFFSPKKYPRVAWLAFSYFFFLLSGYFILRPVRDEIGISQGVQQLPWLFSGTFAIVLLLVPLFGFGASAISRRIFPTAINLLLIFVLMLFYFAISSFGSSHQISTILFVWISVQNLIMVSLFWSVMAESFDRQSALQCYGFISAGGTLGALAGPALAAILVRPLGAINLIWISVSFLVMATFLQYTVVSKQSGVQLAFENRHLSFRLYSGVFNVFKSAKLKSLALFILFYTVLSTFIYFEQATIVPAHYTTTDEKTQYFATLDLLVNGIAVLFQLFITPTILKMGLYSKIFVIVPLIVAFALFALGFLSDLVWISMISVLHRVLHFSLLTPTREGLFTEVDPAHRFESKNFIDTVVFRGGDAMSGWILAGLFAWELGTTQTILTGIFLALLWSGSGYLLTIQFNGKKELSEKHKITI